MKTSSTRSLILGALCALFLTAGALDSKAQDAPFFTTGAQTLGLDPGGNTVLFQPYFREFTLDNFPYVYKYNFGYVYYLGNDATKPQSAYLYDFNSSEIFYTDSTLYPYFYSFTRKAFLYYFEGTSPRSFYNFGTSSVLFE